MRGGSLGGGLRLAVVAAAALAGSGVSVAFQGAQPLGRGQGKPGRIYGYENIRRHLQRQKREARGGNGSLAGRPHNHEREIARRLRQQARDAERRRDRCIACNGFGEHGQVGLSRRGRVLVERDGRIVAL